MTQILAALKAQSTIVADTGDIEAIKAHQPQDATTNPSLLLKASEIEAYQPLLKEALNYAKANESDTAKQTALACDYFSVLIGKEISEVVPGYIST
jgi:transaldolase